MPRIPKKNNFEMLEERLQQSEQTMPEKEATRRGTQVLNQRQNIVAASKGNSKTVKHVLWDPKRIRPWSGHNRDYAALSEDRCQDLIDGFRRVGQQFPSIVRKVTDSADFDYEFICGARRHWTASHLKIDLLIEERVLDDRDAFLLQDIENRDREDISDYERACDYAKALPIYFDGKVTKMAEELQIDPGNFSRFMAMAELPQEIVEAYDDIRDLRTNQMLTYNKILKKPEDRRKVLKAVTKLHGEGLTGTEILSALKKAVAPPQPTNNKSRVGQVKLSKDKNSYRISIELPESDKAVAFAGLKKEINSILSRIDRELSVQNKPNKVTPVTTRNKSGEAETA